MTPVSRSDSLVAFDQYEVVPTVAYAKGAMLKSVPASVTVLCTSGWEDVFRKQYAGPEQLNGCRQRIASAGRHDTPSDELYDLRLLQDRSTRL